MTYELRAEEQMITDFLTLPEDLDLAEAQERLRGAGVPLAVIVDSSGTPVQVISPAGPAPLLTAGRDTPLRAILDTPSMRDRINAGAPVVVVEEGQPVGAVTESTLRNYLENLRVARPKTLGDDALGGGFTQPRMFIKCAKCGAMNELDEFVEDRTMCVNGHLLEVDWD